MCKYLDVGMVLSFCSLTKHLISVICPYWKSGEQEGETGKDKFCRHVMSRFVHLTSLKFISQYYVASCLLVQIYIV